MTFARNNVPYYQRYYQKAYQNHVRVWQIVSAARELPCFVWRFGV